MDFRKLAVRILQIKFDCSGCRSRSTAELGDFILKPIRQVDARAVEIARHKRIITAGGVTSWQNLALYLISRYCGVQHAIDAARVHLLSPHTDGQLPFASMTQYRQHNDAVINDCQDWITKNYDSSNPVARMTGRTDLQPRTFARRFRAATGYHPLDYVQEIRIEMAKNLQVL